MNALNVTLNGTHCAQIRRAFPLPISYLPTSNRKDSECLHAFYTVFGSTHLQTFLCTLCFLGLFEAFCCKWIRSLTFPFQMTPLITQLFHSAFSLSAHKIWSCRVVPQTHSFFQIFSDTLSGDTRVFYAKCSLFSFFTSEKNGFLALCMHNPSRRGTSTCFQVTSYISPLVRHMAVGMRSFES